MLQLSRLSILAVAGSGKERRESDNATNLIVGNVAILIDNSFVKNWNGKSETYLTLVF